LLWDGRTDGKELVKGGNIYQYQFVVQYADGSRATGPRVLFGVNQTTAIAVRLSGSAFKTGSDELSEEAKTTLAKAAEILRKYPQEKIVIEGHTDASGTETYNEQLSLRRAEAVRSLLIEKYAVRADKIVASGYGPRQLADASDPYSGKNRRVQFRVVE